MYSFTIEKLIKLFSDFPSIGPRAAARFVFYLIKSEKKKVEELAKTILELNEKIKNCPMCFSSFEPTESVSNFRDRGNLTQNNLHSNNLCPICSDKTRDKTTIFVVEKQVDLEAIENTKKYKGVYFILGKKEAKEKTEELEKRVKMNRPQINEVILGLNPTAEGINMSLRLIRKLSSYNIKTTQLGIGLPKGGELEYADEETLASAFKGRS